MKSLQNEIDQRISQINERERNFDKNSLVSSQEIDIKYRMQRVKAE